MYESVADDARHAMQVANQVAMRFNHQVFAAEHFLLSVLAQPGIPEICAGLGVEPDVIRRGAEDALAKMPSPLVSVAKKIIDYAIEESQALRHRFTSSHHVLLGILRLTDTFASKMLHEHGLTADRLRDELARRFPPEIEAPEPSLRVLVQQYQSHPEVQALQEQVDALQCQQANALANRDFRAAKELGDKKIESRNQLKALLDRLRKQ